MSIQKKAADGEADIKKVTLTLPMETYNRWLAIQRRIDPESDFSVWCRRMIVMGYAIAEAQFDSQQDVIKATREGKRLPMESPRHVAGNGN